MSKSFCFYSRLPSPKANFKHILQIIWRRTFPLRHMSYLFRLLFTFFHSSSLFLLVFKSVVLFLLSSMTKSNALSIASSRRSLQVYQLLLNLIGFCCDYVVLMHKAIHGTARRTSVNWLKPTTSSATAVYTLQPVVQPRAEKCTDRVTSLAVNPLRQNATTSRTTAGCKVHTPRHQSSGQATAPTRHNWSYNRGL